MKKLTKRRGAALVACLAGLGMAPLVAQAADNQPPQGALGRALFGDDFGAVNDVKLGGWLQLGAVIKDKQGQPGGLGNSPIVLARDSGLQLNQLYFYLEKGIRTNIIPRATPIPAPVFTDYSVGFFVDALYGRDGQPLQTFGWDDRWSVNNPGNENPAQAAQDKQHFLVQPQAYVQAYLPWGKGTAVMLGNFMSPIGNEIGFHPQPGPNIFYSHTYSFAAAPIKHTGVLVATNLIKDDNMGMLAGEFGVVNGWSNFRDNNSDKAYLGALRYRTPGMDTWVDYEFITGDAQSDPSNLSADPVSTASKVNIPVTRVFSASGQKKTQHFLTVSHDWDEDWHAQLGLNVGEIKGDGAPGTVDIITGPGFKGAKWHGVEARLQYKLNSQWSVAGRIEKFQDKNGFALFPNTTVAGNYNAVTIGAQWKPMAALLIRPELRHDWQSNHNGVNAFNSGKSDHQTSVNVDLIYQF